MTIVVKLLAVWLFKAVDKALPSCLNRSTRIVMLDVLLLTITISEAHLPPAANCGNRIAPCPPTPGARVGSVPLVERFVTGKVLKFAPRNLRPITDTGSIDVMVNVPVTSFG